jgi:dihydroorotase
MILISGAHVLTGRGFEIADVLVVGEEIAEVGSVRPGPEMRVVPGQGLYLGPGLVDLHVHFREPGQEHKETIATGSQAAAAGGFTAVVAMPNTTPATDTPEMVADVRAAGRSVGLVEIEPASAVTRGRAGVELVDIARLYAAGVRILTDDGDSVADGALLEKAMAHTASLPGAVIAQHAEDRVRDGEGHVHLGEVSSALGVPGLSRESEVEIVRRDIGIARGTGGRLHVQHVSTAESVDLIAEAKEDGLAVSAEVTPHHLALTEAAVVSGDPSFKMYPPLRTERDRARLVQGLKEGVIDAVATDHAPHSAREKSVSLAEAPRGVIGLETAVPVTLAALGGDVELLFDRMSRAPASIASFPNQGRPIARGGPANLVLIDPSHVWRPTSWESKSGNSPFTGKQLSGRAVMTLYQGQITWDAAR